MAYPNSNVSLEQMLLQFMSEQDPMMSMFQWMCEQVLNELLVGFLSGLVLNFA